MNVAMVSEHASPLAVLGGVDAGGQNVHVAELSAALVHLGHRVRVFTRRDDARLPVRVTMPSGVVVEHVTAGPAAVLGKDELWPHMAAFGRELQRRLELDPADVIHAHFWMSASAALDAARALAVPVVHTFHALGSEKQRMQGAADTSPAVRLAEELRIIRDVDRIVATSSNEIFELCRLGADPRRLKIVPCGVNVAAFDAPSQSFDLPRSQIHRVATLSRLVERKGVGDVISALAEVPDTELIVGGGPAPEDLASDADARRLMRHAEACGVADRVIFAGRVDRRGIPAFLRAADVVVCASWYEPFGIVPLEAMAAARPVIATAVGGQTDTVLDGYTGIHVAPQNPAALAREMRSLLAQPERCMSLGVTGRERVHQRFSWERVARETYGVYRTLMRAAPQELGIEASTA